MRLYLAHPYTGDEYTNTLEAIRLAEEIEREGHDVFVPHLYYYWDNIFRHPYDHWMKKCLSELAHREGLVYRDKSNGVNIELAEAARLCIPVFQYPNYPRST